MKGRKLIILLTSFFVLTLSAFTVCGVTESDDQGDVWHYVFPYYQSQTVSDRPNSDIKEISAEISGDQITFVNMIIDHLTEIILFIFELRNLIVQNYNQVKKQSND